MATDIEKRHIEITLGVCGGRPRIAGHRVRVQDVVVWTEQGQSADEIVANIPSITLSDVYAALAYYHDNREAVDQAIREDDELVDRLRAERAPGILDRLRGDDASEAK